MATKHQLTFYPVGNGDTCQIVTHAGKRVLFDFCHRLKSENNDTPEIDLDSRLKKELKEVSRDYFDVVAFTHADNDHIAGSTGFFELRHAACYSRADRIKIDELWLPAAMLLEEVERGDGKEEFALWKKEGRYRLLEGKGIRVFSQPEALMEWLRPALAARGEAESARDHLFVDAGTIVPGFSLDVDKIEFFCHSPFIEHCDGGDFIRNSAALVFNVRFDADGTTTDFLQVGDAEWCDLEEIVRISKYHGNEDRLRWDIYNLPHHCSYRALSDEKSDTETDPKPLVKELLLSGQIGSYEISSSNPIGAGVAAYESVQPPHVQAKNAYERYLRAVQGRRLLVTMEEPNEKRPEPLLFLIESSGVSWSKTFLTGAGTLVSSSPPRAG